MRQPFVPLPVKLVIGLIAGELSIFKKTQDLLSRKFGKVDLISQVFSFDQTDYYEKDMGKGLKRVFLSFEKLIGPEQLANIKRFTNQLEKKLRQDAGHRSVNIDPGYISLSKLVLATTKSFVHRIYCKDGIFEEITLSFKGKTFTPGPLTYPDYRSTTHITMFNDIRNKYYEQIKKTYGLSQLYRCV
ncbi:MAG: hypothetical protein AUJ74_03675 [Candidatus Omnitrophica bacterium CG1_02_44_16]|nr:MAG: hypothetical protein AUJ74_03675 [Candidatus Omnitrophica bacterium CG1_02_44_16]PIY83299.1 MAG: DUF4416 domain-containing protein [Candidatus Omnitrophica bacterium CG_4_10_14_0_8_um_filter_44_12]PIZ84526.1 MAG: DUF4416 domain-containing protein [Candidatus Omnitrophica bacterium CG_4_10_14_0_2_um_filter_44_9]